MRPAVCVVCLQLPNRCLHVVNVLIVAGRHGGHDWNKVWIGSEEIVAHGGLVGLTLFLGLLPPLITGSGIALRSSGGTIIMLRGLNSFFMLDGIIYINGLRLKVMRDHCDLSAI